MVQNSPTHKKDNKEYRRANLIAQEIIMDTLDQKIISA